MIDASVYIYTHAHIILWAQTISLGEKKNRNKYESKKRDTLTRARLGTINNNAMCIVHFTFNPFFFIFLLGQDRPTRIHNMVYSTRMILYKYR